MKLPLRNALAFALVVVVLFLVGRSIWYSRQRHALNSPEGFHEVFYRGGTWRNTKWLGVRVLKLPLDLFVYQEILYENRPDVLIEAGTYWGGSALFFATIMDMMGSGKVVTIDIEEREGLPEHPRIAYVTGSSTDPTTVSGIRQMIRPGDKVMVVLDSDHSRDHVLAELRIYHELVTPGQYLVVEDTNVNGHPVYPNHGPGPMEALEAFLQENDGFEVDEGREKYLITFNPKGYLRKK